LCQARITRSVAAVASMSAMLGRVGIRQKSEWRIAALVAAVSPPAVSTIVTVTPVCASDCRRCSTSRAA